MTPENTRVTADECCPPGPDLVVIAERGQKGGAGRWHWRADCLFINQPRRRQTVRRALAEGLGRWACPYCAPLPDGVTACWGAGRMPPLIQGEEQP